MSSLKKRRLRISENNTTQEEEETEIVDTVVSVSLNSFI